ncbi:NAD-dependent epimerase/dehydratase family protein [Paraferrimonas sp. SM1919]|uniref:NAD-dependent epimerase/dehydratase family protein n=1 Tax=Paraferrimonas sp. SM1919 TaxID=2662263 RepID=UPI0013D568E4|nr:NAD-dependent epimerase/dehydratase family protein [Paraferrimonas sp. SM1919]
MKVSILGYGWLGKPLAAQLVAQNYQVQVSYHTEKPENQQLTGYPLNLGEGANLEYLAQVLDADVIVVTIPPRDRGEMSLDGYQQKLAPVIQALKPQQKLIFISSTSVYAKHLDVIDETSELDTQLRAQRIINAEQLCLSHGNTTILRCAGLVGGERKPSNFFKTRTLSCPKDAVVNLIHQHDVVNAICKVIQHSVSGKHIYNLCSPYQPLKHEFYSQLIGPSIQIEVTAGKGQAKICADKFTQEYGLEFEQSVAF